ncbi:LysM peptidoglycan-binding domain-containing protein [Nibricoccus sp. IMCC34717]|uniref:LysM peptidoglycan-binding domain-containing protein n=1 Tax=Nibricoccus sp. IMCC34717 TaxID=3034021 RepID=UPI00384E2FBB
MSLRFGVLFALAMLGLPAFGQGLNVEVANLREDVRLLAQRVGELQLRVEELERERAQLAQKVEGSKADLATVAQLNDAVADLEKQIRAASIATKNETLQQVAVQMEKLAKQTNAALDALGGRGATTGGGSAPQTVFRDDFPKEGVEYVVEKGDTLALIAKKTGAKQADIINANRISDPSKIRVGQKLFVPLAK